MPNYRIKRRPDANHVEIVDGLRKHGFDVVDLANMGDGVTDIAT